MKTSKQVTIYPQLGDSLLITRQQFNATRSLYIYTVTQFLVLYTWDENWHIAGGHPTNILVNAPSAGNGTTVVVAGIRSANLLRHLITT